MVIVSESNLSYFNTRTTGIKKYDDLLYNLDFHKKVDNLTYKIRWMSPSEYILRCAKDIFNVSYDRLFDNRNDDKIDKYARQMRLGDKFDMPMINYAQKSQEGLHRAIAAMKNHAEIIPVMIIYRNVPFDKFKPRIYKKECEL